jgi:hypothetical protein
MANNATLLVGHYHKTYNTAYKFWQRRNRAFIMLIVTLGVAALFTYEPSLILKSEIRQNTEIAAQAQDNQSNSAPTTRNAFMFQLVCLYSKCASTDKAELQRLFPYDIFHAGLSIIVFYLMMNMYMNNANLNAFYVYMNELEPEIRAAMGLTGGIAFTREGSFGARGRKGLARLVGCSHRIIAGTLIFLYFYFRISSDLRYSPDDLWVYSCDIS